MTTELEEHYGSEARAPESLAFLVKGYADYAKDVVVERAIDGIDGFKLSQRRIMYTMHAVERVKDFVKSQTLAGVVLKFHPHGDAAVYETMVRMTDSSENMPVPFIKGKGNFGKVYSDEPAASARYTNVKMLPIASELFDLMHGVKMVPSYDNKLKEPTLLPVSYPTLLTNPVEGIAVGLSTSRPSYNFHEVIKAQIQTFKEGRFNGVLYPDFTTGGFVVENEKEARRVMEGGKGVYKLRGRWHIEGKKIIITEIPYYTTENSLKAKIEEIEGVSDVIIATDRLLGFQIDVECTNKKVVEQVLNSILRITDLQMTKTTNTVVIIDNKPRIIGVAEILQEWAIFRRGVVEKAYSVERDGLLLSIDRYTVFTDLLGNEQRRLEFTGALSQEGEASARTLLRKWYPETEKEVFDWILDMKLKQFSGLANKMNTLNGYKARLVEVDKTLADIDGYIIAELEAIDKKYSYPRKTVITKEDYVFDDTDNVVVKAEAVPVIFQVDGKFIKKVRQSRVTDTLEGLRCMSDDVISFIDTQGRLLRVALENIPFHLANERGLYLTRYLETEDDYEVVAYEKIEDKKVGYVYSDGYASVVDYSEWVDAKRTTRITQNGVSPLSGLIINEVDFSRDYIMFLTKDGRFGFSRTDFKHKNRTARTRIIQTNKTDVIVRTVSLTYVEILNLVTSPERYMDKLSALAKGDTINNELYQALLKR